MVVGGVNLLLFSAGLFRRPNPHPAPISRGRGQLPNGLTGLAALAVGLAGAGGAAIFHRVPGFGQHAAPFHRLPTKQAGFGGGRGLGRRHSGNMAHIQVLSKP